ncbi:hypothetical protein COOONC_00454 [Cooperia oncophora]
MTVMPPTGESRGRRRTMYYFRRHRTPTYWSRFQAPPLREEPEDLNGDNEQAAQKNRSQEEGAETKQLSASEYARYAAIIKADEIMEQLREAARRIVEDAKQFAAAYPPK